MELIAEAEKGHGHAHVSLLAARLGVKKPSVVQMIDRLAALGIVKRAGKEISLTREGARLGHDLGDRHSVLKTFMVVKLRIRPDAADREACRLEHTVSPEFLRGLRKLMQGSSAPAGGTPPRGG